MIHLVRRYLPQILIGLTITSIMLVAYAATGFAFATSPKTTWTTSPLNITFLASDGSGSASDSFTCSQTISAVTLRVIVSNPTRISLTASPASSANCNTTPTAVTFTAQCLVSAANCKGTYQGLVQIRQPDDYRVFPANLKIVITVN